MRNTRIPFGITVQKRFPQTRPERFRPSCTGSLHRSISIFHQNYYLCTQISFPNSHLQRLRPRAKPSVTKTRECEIGSMPATTSAMCSSLRTAIPKSVRRLLPQGIYKMYGIRPRIRFRIHRISSRPIRTTRRNAAFGEFRRKIDKRTERCFPLYGTESKP